MKKITAIRHVGFEGLGAFEPALVRQGYEIKYLDGTSFEDLGTVAEDADILAILGGPIGAYQEKEYPFLKNELNLIENRLNLGKPLMGVCLGAQLIARALGARVYPSGHTEIGLAPITLTRSGHESCLSGFSEKPMTLHWHGDTFDLPDNADLLASTDLCTNQAYALGDAVISFQFHPEASLSEIESWLVGHAYELAAAGVDVCQLRVDAKRYQTELEQKADETITKWISKLPS